MYADHDHRGQYAEDRHDHDGDYAEKYHRHYDDESTARGLREDLGRAEARISELEGRVGELEGDQVGMRALLRVLDLLRPTCVLCHDQAADRQTVNGPACTDCVGDLPDGGPDPDRPETWAFGEAPVQPIRPDEDQAAEDTRRLGEIRAILAAFDWEHDDRQLALEAIDRIADGGQAHWEPSP